MSQDTNGIICMLKPAGISSFGLLKSVQKKLDLKKVGHLGTLDPAACGVLVLLVGRACKLNQQLNNGEYRLENKCIVLDTGATPGGGTKVYRSVFTFGKETTTLDNEGEIVAESDVIPTRNQIKKALMELVGEVEIEVPKFSAVHINGKRAYDLARKGINFAPPKKVVKIDRFELLNETKYLDLCRTTPLGLHEFYFEIECQTGTYIRSLAKLLAERLGTLAIASSIIRTKVGEFSIDNAKSLLNVQHNDIINI